MSAYKNTDALAEIPAVWKWSAISAVVLTLASAPFADLPQWTVTIPVCLGIGLGVFLCYRAGQNFQMKDFRSDFWLKLRGSKSRKTKGQLDMFDEVVPETADRKRICRITTNEETLYLVSADHFQDLLVSRTTDDIDRATEHALGVAWKSIPASMRPDLSALLHNTVRDVIKNDMRGSMVKMISHIGEGVLSDLEESPEVESQGGPFKLEPVTVGKKGRR